MTKCRFIAEVGSCHLNDLGIAKQFIREARKAGAWAVKFQWIDEGSTESEHNAHIFLPESWIPELKKEADKQDIHLFFSVFGEVDEKMDKLAGYDIKHMKFPFSQRRENRLHGMRAAQKFDEVFVTVNVEDRGHIADDPKMTVLYTAATPMALGDDFRVLYPPPYEVAFDFLDYRTPFHGLSDHTLGIRQTLKAVAAGCTVIEKHCRLDSTTLWVPHPDPRKDNPQRVHDAAIAITFEELGAAIRGSDYIHDGYDVKVGKVGGVRAVVGQKGLSTCVIPF